MTICRPGVAHLGLLALLALASTAARAESEWVPFKDTDMATKRIRGAAVPASVPPPLAPMGGIGLGSTPAGPGVAPGFGSAYPGAPGSGSPAPFGGSPGPAAAPVTAANSKIEWMTPEPVQARDGSGLTTDSWRGVDMKTLEEMLAGLTLPPRSPALARLWTRLLTAEIDPPAGGRTPAHFEAVRLEALYRAGHLEAMGKRLAAAPSSDPIFQALMIRHALAVNNTATACQSSKALMGRRAELPKTLVAELHLLAGYCAAAEGNPAGAGLAAELAREAGVDAPVAIAALDALAGNGKTGLAAPKQVRVLDYRLLSLLGAIDPAQILDKAEAPLIAAMALDEQGEPQARVAAVQGAAVRGAISIEQLLAIYRAAPEGADDPGLRRAELVRRVGSEPQVGRKLQYAKSALDDARRTGHGAVMGRWRSGNWSRRRRCCRLLRWRLRFSWRRATCAPHGRSRIRLRRDIGGHSLTLPKRHQPRRNGSKISSRWMSW
jgi:hypothetical protein